MPRSLIKTSLGFVVFSCAIGAAFAQYVWIDSKGVRQYSDQPPPSSIPKKHIMKDPGFELRTFSSASSAPSVSPSNAQATAPASAATGVAPPAPVTSAEKNAEFIKRQADKAEKDRKAADDAKEAAAKAKNCERVQAYVHSLNSGERITTTDKNGERAYLSDEKRAQETAEATKALNGCK